jgi:hypothetical protein
MITLHQGHHPEIELTSPTTATGTRYLEDQVIDAKRNTTLRGRRLLPRRVREARWRLEAPVDRLRAHLRALDEPVERDSIAIVPEVGVARRAGLAVKRAGQPTGRHVPGPTDAYDDLHLHHCCSRSVSLRDR